MGYLRTVLTYDRPSEAEVDKTFLESRGIAVCLLNGETTRNELGAPFHIRLQVNEGDFENARNALQESNPQRFGSAAVVEEIDRQVKRSVAFFFAASIPIALIAYALIPPTTGSSAPLPAPVLPLPYGGRITPDLRIVSALVIAIIAGIASSTVAAKRSRSNSP
jgi:hypothetical protein